MMLNRMEGFFLIELYNSNNILRPYQLQKKFEDIFKDLTNSRSSLGKRTYSRIYLDGTHTTIGLMVLVKYMSIEPRLLYTQLREKMNKKELNGVIMFADHIIESR